MVWYTAHPRSESAPAPLRELVVLREGLRVEVKTNEHVFVKVRVQSVGADLPAKALLLNMKQFNGEFGCSHCRHPGTYNLDLTCRLDDYLEESPNLESKRQ